MKKPYLEFVRGLAAIIVLGYHCIELHPAGTGPKQFYLSNWGTDAVMVFFILSGVVINMSQTHNPKSSGKFIVNRLIRLYPQFLIGLLLGLLVLYLSVQPFPSIGVLFGNLLMISTLKEEMNYIVPCIDSNSPIWTLTFEIAFYALFAITIGRHQKKLIFIWFIVALGVMPLYYFKTQSGVLNQAVAILSFSAVWLIGYYLYEFRHLFYTDKYTAFFSAGTLPLISRLHLTGQYYDPVKYLLFAIFAVPFFRFCLQVPTAGKKIKLYYLIVPYCLIVYVVFTQPYITFFNWVLYSALPVGFAALCLILTRFDLAKQFTSFIIKTGRVTGKYSYSLYISHYPVLFLCATLFHQTPIYLLAGLPVILTITFVLEKHFQPAVAGHFKSTRKASALR